MIAQLSNHRLSCHEYNKSIMSFENTHFEETCDKTGPQEKHDPPFLELYPVHRIRMKKHSMDAEQTQVEFMGFRLKSELRR